MPQQRDSQAGCTLADNTNLVQLFYTCKCQFCLCFHVNRENYSFVGWKVPEKTRYRSSQCCFGTRSAPITNNRGFYMTFEFNCKCMFTHYQRRFILLHFTNVNKWPEEQTTVVCMFLYKVLFSKCVRPTKSKTRKWVYFQSWKKEACIGFPFQSEHLTMFTTKNIVQTFKLFSLLTNCCYQLRSAGLFSFR